MKQESRKATYYLVVLPAVVVVASVVVWAIKRVGQGIGDRSRACVHPDIESLLGRQSVDWFPLRFRCEWFPPAPATPAHDTGMAATVLFIAAVVALVVAGVMLWRGRATDVPPVAIDEPTPAAQNPHHPEDWDRSLMKLRKDGFSADEAAKVTRTVLQVTLPAARRIVRDSELWSD